MTLLQAIPIADTGMLPALVKDYLSRDEKVRSLYNYYPEIESFKQIIADKKKDNTNRELLVEVLRKQYANITTSSYVAEHITSLLNPDTFTITAAHQPVLFTGPLFNIYKISSAINLAKQLKQAYPQYTFVPVFWMGSEDHDIDELNNATINGKSYQWAEGTSGAVGRIDCKVVEAAFAELKLAVGENDAVKIIEEGLVKYNTIGKLTQYIINEVFKEHGLVVINQDDTILKQSLSEVIIDEVLYSRAVSVLTPTLQWLEENYRVQAKPREINFFYLGEGYRERVVYNAEKGSYSINKQNVEFTKSELVNEISNYPENFSPNVFFRPLYQEMVLPNVAFIGGAGELSYWLELKPLFDYYKVNFPALVMRSMAAILQPSAYNKLQKLNLQFADFFNDVELLVNEYVKQQTGSATSLDEQKLQLEEMYNAIAAKAEAVDVTLVQSVAAEKQKALTTLDNISGKMHKAEKRKQETAINQIRSIHAALLPNGGLQERTENFVSFYSPAFIQECVQTLDPLKQQFYFLLNY